MNKNLILITTLLLTLGALAPGVTALPTVEETVQRVIEAVHTLGDRMTIAEASILTHESDISALETENAAQQTQLGGLDTAVTSLQSDVGVLQSDSTNIWNEIVSIWDFVNAHETTLGTHAQLLSDHEILLIGHGSMLDDLNITQVALSQSIAQLGGDVSLLQSDVASAEVTLNDHQLVLDGLTDVPQFIQVQLIDNNAGNELGWSPSGAQSFFGIIEPGITGQSVVSITMDNVGQSVNACSVLNLAVGSTFTIRCDVAPANGGILNYVVMNP
ncbi:MAG: hypothetical protein AABW68_02565 [archaeon]